MNCPSYYKQLDYILNLCLLTTHSTGRLIVTVSISDKVYEYLRKTYLKTGWKILKSACDKPWQELHVPIMNPPVPNLSKIIDLYENENVNEKEKKEKDQQKEYEAEAILFRSFEKLANNIGVENDLEADSLTDLDRKRLQIVVLHGFKYKHLLFKEIFNSHDCTSVDCEFKHPHLCHKKEKDREGEADFIVIGDSYFATFEVKHCGIENILENLSIARNQAERTGKLLGRIMEVVNGNNLPIFKFCAFPLIKRSDVTVRENLVDAKSVLFEEDVSALTIWWKENIGNLAPKDHQFISEEVKAIVCGFGGSIDTNKYFKKIDDQLRKSLITREYKVGGEMCHNNSEVFEIKSENIQKALDIKYFRREQMEALKSESTHLTINGTAGSGKTKILQARLLMAVSDSEPGAKKPVVFSVAHDATNAHKELIRGLGFDCEHQKIGIKSISNKKMQTLKKLSTEKVLIFSIPVINFTDPFLNRIFEVVKNFTDHKIFIDDIQCFLLWGSITGFKKLMRLLRSCAFVRLAIDVVQIFYFPQLESKIRVLKDGIKSISCEPMEIANLQTNLRNSYEVSSLLRIVRDEFGKNFLDSTNNINIYPQRFAHFIHGPRPTVHYVRSSKRGNLAGKLADIIARERKILGLQDEDSGNSRGQLTNKDFQILRFNGPKGKSKQALTHDLELPDHNRYTNKIRYSYSSEWAAVVALLCVNSDTIYQEFISRLYLAASRARVYCSVIVFVKCGEPPPFLKEFLKRVQDESLTIVKECRVRDTSVKAQLEVVLHQLNKKMRI